MTLATENDVRWAQTANSLERNSVEWLDEDFEPGNKSTENGANFARARPLAVYRVVYEIN